MAIYSWSSLINGQTISFDPNADGLFFDPTSISAADLSINWDVGQTQVQSAMPARSSP